MVSDKPVAYIKNMHTTKIMDPRTLPFVIPFNTGADSTPFTLTTRV